MKIAFVCGHYLPDLGYLEVHLARALVKLNHNVTVITSSAVPAYVKSKVKRIPAIGEADDGGVHVIRLKPVLAFGQLVWCRGVRKEVEAIHPELVIAIGLGKIFPRPVLRSVPYKLAVLLGDNSHTYSKMNWRQRTIQRFIKKPVYEKAMAAADRIFSYTPETVSVLKDWISESGMKYLGQKNTFISLGFDQQTFYESPRLRQEGRAELAIDENEVLLISVARMGANKNFTGFLKAFESQVENGQPVKCLLVGIGDDPFSTAIKNQIESSPVSHRFITRPFVNHEELNRLYNASDIGYWPITAISIYEGMGTGLFLLVPESGSLSHLELNGVRGQYVRENLHEDLRSAMKNYHRISREERAEKSRNSFSYQTIATRLLETMKSV